MYIEILVYFSISFSFSLLSGYSQFVCYLCVFARVHICVYVCL